MKIPLRKYVYNWIVFKRENTCRSVVSEALIREQRDKRVFPVHFAADRGKARRRGDGRSLNRVNLHLLNIALRAIPILSSRRGVSSPHLQGTSHVRYAD